MERLRRRFPHVLVLGFAPETGCRPRDARTPRGCAGRSDLEVATDFVAHVRGPAEPAEVDAAGRRRFEAVPAWSESAR